MSSVTHARGEKKFASPHEKKKKAFKRLGRDFRRRKGGFRTKSSSFPEGLVS